jgi:alpha-ketoglutarate-dependent taurine dioxygenase
VKPIVVDEQGSGSPQSLIDRLADRRDEIRSQLQQHGAMVFRGFGRPDASELSRAAEAFAEKPPMNYVGGDSPRSRVEGAVYTSTELPPDLRLGLHHEMSYLASAPRYLYFLCVQPAPLGGDTLFADGREVLRALDPEVRARFEARGVRYRYAYPGESTVVRWLNRWQNINRTWMDIYETHDRAEAERRCRGLGFEAEWEGDRLVAHGTRPATRVHPDTGEQVWFNQAHLFELLPRAIGAWRYYAAQIAFTHPDLKTHGATFGDGTPIPRADLERVHDALDASTVCMPLQAGDLVVFDNLLCMHGRKAFRGPRRLLVAMTS